MKKLLFLSLFLVALLGCTKDQTVVEQLPATTSPELALDRGPNCGPTEIRVDIANPTFTVFEEFYVFRNPSIPVWRGDVSSSDCSIQNVLPGIWYPISLLNNVQYEMRYTFKQPCNTFKARAASFSIRVGGNYVYTFPLQTNPPAINMDYVSFYKSGCQVLEGVIE